MSNRISPIHIPSYNPLLPDGRRREEVRIFDRLRQQSENLLDQTPPSLLLESRFQSKDNPSDFYRKLNHEIFQVARTWAKPIFRPKKFRCLGCMDGGVPVKSVGLGGQGILLALSEGKLLGLKGLEAIRAGMDAVVRACTPEPGTEPIYAVISHEGCAAAAIAFNELSEKEQAIFETGDFLGMWFTKEIANRLGARYLHVDTKRMTRMPNDIPSQVAFYVDLEDFRADLILAGALAFTISRGALKKSGDPKLGAERAKSLLKTAAEVAFGPKGLGELFTKENPFLFVPVGKDSAGLEEVHAEAESVAAELDGRVVVLPGFSEPNIAASASWGQSTPLQTASLPFAKGRVEYVSSKDNLARKLERDLNHRRVSRRASARRTARRSARSLIASRRAKRMPRFNVRTARRSAMVRLSGR